MSKQHLASKKRGETATPRCADTQPMRKTQESALDKPSDASKTQPLDGTKAKKEPQQPSSSRPQVQISDTPPTPPLTPTKKRYLPYLTKKRKSVGQTPVQATERDASPTPRRSWFRRQTVDILAYLTPHRTSSLKRLLASQRAASVGTAPASTSAIDPPSVACSRISDGTQPLKKFLPGPLSPDNVKIFVSKEDSTTSADAQKPILPRRVSPPTVVQDSLQELLSGLTTMLSSSSLARRLSHASPVPRVTQQRLLTLLQCCSCCIFIAILYIFLFFGVPKTTSVCSSSACLFYSKLLWDTLNLSANPCDDFYGYVCSKWEATHTFTFKEGVYFKMIKGVADRNLRTAVPAHGQSAVQKAAKFYQACLAIYTTGGEQEQRAIKNLLISSGVHWPRLSNASNPLRISFGISSVLGWAPIILFSMTRPGHILVSPSSFYYTVLATRQTMMGTGSGDREYNIYFRLMRKAFAQEDLSSTDVLSYSELLALESEVVLELRQAYTLATKDDIENATLDDVLRLAGNAIPRSTWEDVLRENYKSEDLGDTMSYSFTIDNVNFFQTFFEVCSKVGEPLMAYYVGWVAAQAWSLLTKPEIVRFYYPMHSDGSDGHSLLCAVIAQEFMGLAFHANYIREEVSAEDVGDVNVLTRNVHTSFTEGFPASVAWRNFIVKSVLSLEQKISSPSASGAPMSFVNEAKEEPLNALFDYFPDMGPHFLKNAMRAATARRMTSANTRMAGFRWNSTVRFHYLTKDEGFELLPVALEAPFYSSQAPLSVKYGALGAEIGDATAALVFQRLRDADTDTQAALGSEALCVLSAETPVKVALPASLKWSHIPIRQLAEKAMSLDAVLRAFLRATEGGEEPRLDGFESLSGKQLLFIFWCLAQCGVADGKYKCNDPLKLFHFFARTFECKASSAMFTRSECI